MNRITAILPCLTMLVALPESSTALVNFKRKLIALCIALSVLLTLPSQALASYSLTNWGPRLDSNGTSYTYLTEVCVDASTGSSVWDTANIPLHARAQNAMAQWNNNTNGEFFFQVSNSCSSTDTEITIFKANYGQTGWKARLEWPPTTCTDIEPWNDCIWHADLKINIYYPWWNQAGAPNPNQYDLYSAFTHEFGHMFSAPDLAMWTHPDCLTNTEPAGSSMCDSFGLGSSWRRTPSTSDINAYISRYGTTH